MDRFEVNKQPYLLLQNREIESASSSSQVMCIDEPENGTSSLIKSSVSEFQDNNGEDIVIGELIVDCVQLKRRQQPL